MYLGVGGGVRVGCVRALCSLLWHSGSGAEASAFWFRPERPARHCAASRWSAQADGGALVLPPLRAKWHEKGGRVGTRPTPTGLADGADRLGERATYAGWPGGGRTVGADPSVACGRNTAVVGTTPVAARGGRRRRRRAALLSLASGPCVHLLACGVEPLSRPTPIKELTTWGRQNLCLSWQRLQRAERACGRQRGGSRQDKYRDTPTARRSPRWCS